MRALLLRVYLPTPSEKTEAKIISQHNYKIDSSLSHAHGISAIMRASLTSRLIGVASLFLNVNTVEISDEQNVSVATVDVQARVVCLGHRLASCTSAAVRCKIVLK